MARRDQFLSRLGPEGLRVVLRDSLDHAGLVRLANGCGASVKGMRNQAVSAERLAAAVAGRAREDPSAGTRVLRSLSRLNRDFLAQYARWPKGRARQRLARAVSRPGAASGPLLFALAREPRDGLGDEEILAAAEVIAERTSAGPDGRGTVPKRTAKVSSARAEVRVLRRENTELARRLGTLESHLAKLQERLDKTRKELAESRLEAGNLKLAQGRSRAEQSRAEREIATLSRRLEEAASRRDRDRLELAARALEEAADRQEGFDRTLETLVKTEIDRLQAEAVRTREALRKQVEAQVKGSRDRAEQLASALVSVRQELAELRRAQEERVPGRRRRARGEPERVGVYVDVQNVYYPARDEASRLDFSKLIETACRSRRLVRAVAYVVESKETDQSGFISLLQSHSYEVKRKSLKVRADGSMKANWDLEIALDVLADASQLDVVVLVTGDGDFVSLARELKRLGPTVEVYSFPRSTAQELREVADRFVPVTRRMLLPLPPGRSGGKPRAKARRKAKKVEDRGR